MTTRYKTVSCTECGIDILVPATSYKARRCAACSEARYIKNLVGIMTKSGPEYEKWIAGVRAAAARRPRRGIPEDRSSEPQDLNGWDMYCPPNW